MSRIREIVSVSALVATGSAILLARRRRSVGRLLGNLHRYSAPSVGAYDSLGSRFLGGFYQQVVRETADLAASGKLLDVGSGPGHLAVALARAYPELRVVGVDISPEMVGRAREMAQQASVADRVMFELGDVGALPFPDASYEVVLSTLSMHHWPDPGRGLAEVNRVLMPNGVARIYDVADWVRWIGRRGTGIADLAASSPFGGGQVTGVFRLGPIPIVRRVELRKAGAGDDLT